MAKDPAVLFYTSDFLTGTMFMTDDQIGKYIKLLCIQHQRGGLTEKEMLKVCITPDEDIFSKFEKIGDLFFNKRMKEESEKRKKYTESRRNNRSKGDNENVHIYFIQDNHTGLVKIGSSVNPERRIIELRSEFADIQLLFYTEKTSQKLESELHNYYKSFHSFLEWYNVKHIIKDIQEYLMCKDIKLHMINDMCNHMENEIENENINIIKEEKEFEILEMKAEQVEVEEYPIFEDFWNEYDKKVGEKGKIKKKWQSLSLKDREAIMDYIPNYKASQPDKQYRKNPETFLNNKSWNDELIFENGKKQQNTGNDKAGKWANHFAKRAGTGT